MTTTIEDKGGYKEHEAQIQLCLLKDRREIQEFLRPYKEDNLKMWPWNRSIQPQIVQTQTTLSRGSSKCVAKSHSQLTSRSPERSRARFLGRLGYWCSSPTVSPSPTMSPSHSQPWQFLPSLDSHSLFISSLGEESSCPMLVEMSGYHLFFNCKRWTLACYRVFDCVSGYLSPCWPIGQTLCRSVLLFAFSVNHV